MFSSFKKVRPAEPALVVEHEAPSSGADLRAAIDSIGKQASSLGREAAEVRGLMDDTQKVSARQAQTMNALAGKVQEITKAQDAISGVSQDSLGAVDRARKAVTMRIGAALRAIEAADPALARHLRNAVKTGRSCTYRPDGDVTWHT